VNVEMYKFGHVLMIAPKARSYKTAYTRRPESGKPNLFGVGIAILLFAILNHFFQRGR
jgi:hypothetical protein